jgi:hypothetical protein
MEGWVEGLRPVCSSSSCSLNFNFFSDIGHERLMDKTKRYFKTLFNGLYTQQKDNDKAFYNFIYELFSAFPGPELAILKRHILCVREVILDLFASKCHWIMMSLWKYAGLLIGREHKHWYRSLLCPVSLSRIATCEVRSMMKCILYSHPQQIQTEISNSTKLSSASLWDCGSHIEASMQPKPW